MWILGLFLILIGIMWTLLATAGDVNKPWLGWLACMAGGVVMVWSYAR